MALTFVSINVGGLNDVDRRRRIYFWLRSLKVDVILLQETHCSSDENAALWTKEWSGIAAALQPNELGRGAWFSISPSSHTGGTAVLLSKDFRHRCEVLNVYKEERVRLQGTWTSVYFKYKKQIYRVDSVYISAQHNVRRRHITAYFDHESVIPHRHWVTAGDWNCVEMTLRDVDGSDNYVNSHGLYLAERRMNTLLSDVWVEHNSPADLGGFTRHSSEGCRTRINRVYVSPELTEHLREVSVVSTPGFTDHEAVYFSVGKKVKRKSPFWRLNVSVLRSPECDDLVLKTYQWWYRKRTQDMPLIHWWSRWKQLIREVLKSYSVSQASRRKKALRDLCDQLDIEVDYLSLQRLKGELDIVFAERAERAAVSAGAARESVGDTPTSAFFAQAAIRAQSRDIQTIKHPTTGATVVLTAEVQKIITDFWKTVFGEDEYHQRDQPSSPERQSAIASLAR